MYDKRVNQEFGKAKAPLGSKLSRMSGLPRSIRIVFVLGILFSGTHSCLAQSPTVTDTPQNAAVLTKLSPPVYPPIALTAHITGDIELLLNIRKDGSVESASVIGGPPLLQRAALSSATQSQFQCVRCVEELTPYHLFYAFRLDIPADACTGSDSCNKSVSVERAPEVALSENHITLTNHIIPVYIPEYRTRVRSAKCLYLWKCGLV
jgi:Gram-negative bacterial TonB protein C-terminal